MKKIVILACLILSFSFAGVTRYGGIAFKDQLVIDAASDLISVTIVTSRNGSAAAVTTVNRHQLPTQYSVYHIDSTSATINFQLVTDNRRVDGQIIVLDCIGYSKPISITTNVIVSAKPVASAGSFYVDTVLDSSTANLAMDALGDAIVLQYCKRKGKYVIISNDL